MVLRNLSVSLQPLQAVLVHNGTRVFTFSMLFHDAKLPLHLQHPTFVCAFNSGWAVGAWGGSDGIPEWFWEFVPLRSCTKMEHS